MNTHAMKSFASKLTPFIASALTLLAPLSFALAAAPSLSLEAVSAAAPGATFSIPVRLNPAGIVANVVEGKVSIPQGVVIQSIDTGGSAVLLWAEGPSAIIADHVITFSGGAPQGFSSKDPSLLFTIHASAPAVGEYRFSAASASAYEGDGKGTRHSLAVVPVVQKIEAGATASAPTPADHAAPETLMADIGSDATLFGGKSYVAFYGSDQGSGIVRYAVKEGWFGSYVPAERYYILSDQTLSSRVWVRAYDAAGNARTTVIVPQNPLQEEIAVGVLGVIALALAWFALPRVKRRYTK